MKKENINKIRMLIGLIFSFTLLLVVFSNIYKYFNLKHEAEHCLHNSQVFHLGQSIDLVGLLDSYGVPYSPSIERGFMEYLREDLNEQGVLSSFLDLYGLYINKTWELNGIFQNDVTIGEMKMMQNFGLDFVRHKYGSKRIREDLIYSCDEYLKNRTVASYYNELKKPVVLLSCTANDLFYYFNTSLESLSISKILKILKNYGNSLCLLRTHVESNLETLISYNPNSVILVMGLYVPSENFFLQRVGGIFVERINDVLKDACRRYPNAEYVDVSCLSFTVLDGDFHPDENGHRILKYILEEKIASLDLRFDKEKEILFVKKNNLETGENFSKESFTIEEWIEWIDQSNYPKKDYVEWSVAAEQILYEKGFDDVSYRDLKTFMDRLPMDTTETVKRGLEILLLERKIHEGYDIKNFTINPDVKNDKISLLGFYTRDNKMLHLR